MSQDPTILRQIYDSANRANPYPLWAKLRQTPVCWQEDGPDEAGTYVVSTYREIMALLHDPRVSSDMSESAQTGGRPLTSMAPHRFVSLAPPGAQSPAWSGDAPFWPARAPSVPGATVS